MPEGTFTRTWAHPESAGEFAALWRIEVEGARELGRRIGPQRYREARYERLVAEPDEIVRELCAFADIPFEPAMLDYPGAVDVSRKPHQQRLLQPPTTGVRDWRSELGEVDVRAFEAVAGDLLADLGYELVGERRSPARLPLVWYQARLAAWNTAAAAVQRSPLWRRRHARLTTPAAPSERPGPGRRSDGR
jgi:hypothetical protein